MQSLLSTLQTMMACGTIIVIAGMVVLALPNSKMRDFLLPIVSWCFAIFCGIYCISPVDIVPEAFLGPFGLIDDLGAAVAGVMAAKTAMNPQAG